MSFSVSASTIPANDTLKFYGQTLTLSATSGGGPLQSGEYIVNQFYFGGYSPTTTCASSASGILQSVGTVPAYVVGIVRSGSGLIVSAATSNFLDIRVNNLPEISFDGTLAINTPLTFQDDNGGTYITSTIVSADWDFGDGSTSSTVDTTDTFEHTYSAVGIYDVSSTVYDVSGNSAASTVSISIFEGASCVDEEEYITTLGPEMLGRFGAARQINLVDFLPLYLKETETEDFLVLFENFLNEMFSGLGGWNLSANDLTVTKDWDVSGAETISADAVKNYTYDLCGTSMPTEATDVDQIELHWPTNSSLATSAHKISILEKVARITELHDPDLIDLDYIQFFASNLGYNVNVSRDEVGVSGTSETLGVGEANELNKYLRFIVRNLPTWYKIKTTRNSIKVMLYSFGLVGDILEYFTDSYWSREDGGNWRLDYDNDFREIPSNWFPTPHFAIRIDVDESSDISFDISRRAKVIRAIESIRPINDVFRRLIGYAERDFNMVAGAWIRSTRYIIIESDGYANGWG